MQFSCRQEVLIKPLQFATSVVENRKTLPILANVLINVGEDTVTLTATDLEIEIVAKLTEADIVAPGQITVPGRKFVDIVKTLPAGEPVNISLDGERVAIKCQRSRFVLSTLPASDYPNTEYDKGELELSLPQADLLFLLERTLFSIAQQDVRYFLNGLLLEITPNQLTAVATDGHRLALAEVQGEFSVPTNKVEVIVPRKAVIELVRLLKTVNEPIDVVISRNYIQMTGLAFSFGSKLIDGRFPDYRAVVPKTSNITFKVNKEEITRLLTRIAVLANEKYRGVELQIRSNVLSVYANNPEQERATDELEIDYQGADLNIGFNVNYLIEALNNTSSGEVKFSFGLSDTGLLMEETDESTTLYVIMPMHL